MNLAIIPCIFTIFIVFTILFILFYVDTLPKREAKKNGKTYFISLACSKLNFMPKIICLKCNRTSYHPKDVKHKYCANCNMFHE